jgi:hypothetical protein
MSLKYLFISIIFTIFDYFFFQLAKGWFIKHIAESVSYPYNTLIWHSGGLLGTSTILLIFPDYDIIGVAFANKGFVLESDQLILCG